MKLYKYRDLSKPNDEAYKRLSKTLCQNSFWCAPPSALNDREEFVWICDYKPTDCTISLFAQVIARFQNRTSSEANMIAAKSVRSGKFETLAKPIVQTIINKCREELGLVCFGTSGDNPVCWERYGGAGSGVCIEIETSSDLVDKQLFYVQYIENKSMHIDQLFRSVVDPSYKKHVYKMALLSKPQYWASEEEIRFVSKTQNISVCLDGSRISSLILGPSLTIEALGTIKRIAESLPCQLPISTHKT